MATGCGSTIGGCLRPTRSACAPVAMPAGCNWKPAGQMKTWPVSWCEGSPSDVRVFESPPFWRPGGGCRAVDYSPAAPAQGEADGLGRDAISGRVDRSTTPQTLPRGVVAAVGPRIVGGMPGAGDGPARVSFAQRRG